MPRQQDIPTLKTTPTLPDSTKSSPRSFALSKPAPAPIKSYPFKKCLVTGESLDEWDEMQTLVYEGQEMKFCCKVCVKKFEADPEKYLSQLP